MGISLCILR